MSLSLCDELRIVLQPERVLVAHSKRVLTRRGLRRQVQAVRTVACDPDSGDGLPWSAAITALGMELAECPAAHASATVIVSNRFMRYALVPWADALNDEVEELAFARHTFGELYGHDSGPWDLRISSGRTGTPQMACAADGRLIATLRELFGQSCCRLRSIQPHLMLAYNACYQQLRGRSAWLAVIERGNLCLGLLQEGRWAWVRTMRMDGEASVELPLLLDREAHLALPAGDVDEVLLWAPEHEMDDGVANGRWKFSRLQPHFIPGRAAEIDSRYDMYLSV